MSRTGLHETPQPHDRRSDRHVLDDPAWIRQKEILGSHAALHHLPNRPRIIRIAVEVTVVDVVEAVDEHEDVWPHALQKQLFKQDALLRGKVMTCPEVVNGHPAWQPRPID